MPTYTITPRSYKTASSRELDEHAAYLSRPAADTLVMEYDAYVGRPTIRARIREKIERRIEAGEVDSGWTP